MESLSKSVNIFSEVQSIGLPVELLSDLPLIAWENLGHIVGDQSEFANVLEGDAFQNEHQGSNAYRDNGIPDLYNIRMSDVPPSPPLNIFDDSDLQPQEGTTPQLDPQTQLPNQHDIHTQQHYEVEQLNGQLTNLQPLMPTQPIVVPAEDENHIPVSDAIEQLTQQPSTGLTVSASQPSNKFQAVRGNSNILVPVYAVPQSAGVSMAQQQQTFSVAKTGGVVDVPALTDMEGEYGFSVTIEEKERTTKSPMWLMSTVTNKLYTNINKAVPFEMRLNKKVPSDKSFFVRAVAVFSSAQFLRTNVTRCPNHASNADITNHDFPYPEHVVRADHPEAKYEKNSNGRLSVVVPLDILVDGSDYTPILLRFMCLGSCVGGINRRPIAIILTLENELGQICGRKVIDVRVCACPTRDIRIDDQALLNKGGKRRGSSVQDKTLPPPRKKPKIVEPKLEPQEDDDDNRIFTINVKGRKLYEFLMLVKESYLKTHPECSDRYHNTSLQNEDDSEDEVKSSSNQGLDVGDSDSFSWDSGCNYTQQVGVGFCNDSEVDLISGPKNNSPLSKLKPNISISPSDGLRLWPEDPGIPSSHEESYKNDHSSKMGDFINNSKTVGITVSSDSIFSSMIGSPLPKRDDSVLKHIPVMQVESYQPRALTAKAKSVQALKPNFSDSKAERAKKIQMKKNTRETIHNPSYEQTESLFESSPRKAYMSPDSPEMLAANVLAGGFKGKSVFKTTIMK